MKKRILFCFLCLFAVFFTGCKKKNVISTDEFKSAAIKLEYSVKTDDYSEVKDLTVASKDGYEVSFFVFYDEDVTLPIGLICASDFLYNFVFYIFSFLIRNRLHLGYYLVHIMFPEMLYTVIVMLILYRPMLWVNHKIENKEKRGASRFD